MGLLENFAQGMMGGASSPLEMLLGGNPMQNPEFMKMFNQLTSQTGGDKSKALNIALDNIAKNGISNEEYGIIQKLNPQIAEQVKKYVK